jgi:hypothetical protein
MTMLEGNMSTKMTEGELRKAQKAVTEYLRALEESRKASAEHHRALLEREKAEEEFHKTYAEYYEAETDAERARTYPGYQKAYEEFMKADANFLAGADKAEIASRKAEEEWAETDVLWHKVDVMWEEKLLDGEGFFAGVVETDPQLEPIPLKLNKASTEVTTDQAPGYDPVGKYWDGYPDVDRRFIHANGEAMYEGTSTEKNPTASRQRFHENETAAVQDMRQALHDLTNEQLREVMRKSGMDMRNKIVTRVKA